ncbi:hypothetical protein [Paraburkholderia xenovorans]
MAHLYYYHQLTLEQQVQALKFSEEVRPEWQCYMVDYRGDVLRGLPLTPILQTGMVRVADSARAQLALFHRAEIEFVVRHAIGDWSEMAPDECAANHLAIEDGAPVISRYAVGDIAQVYVVTPADRRHTQVMVSLHVGSPRGVQ